MKTAWVGNLISIIFFLKMWYPTKVCTNYHVNILVRIELFTHVSHFLFKVPPTILQLLLDWINNFLVPKGTSCDWMQEHWYAKQPKPYKAEEEDKLTLLRQGVKTQVVCRMPFMLSWKKSRLFS